MTALVALLLLGVEPLHKERVVPAPVAEVFKAWTTNEGARSFFAPDSNIDATEGGAYELFFNAKGPIGERGSEMCTVLAVEPNKKLVFSWNFPPSLPSLRRVSAQTQVTVTFAPAGAGTKVTLVQAGFKDEADWAQGRAYFDRAWDVVLARLERRFKHGPVDFSWPYDVKQVSWLAGAWKLGDDLHGAQEVWFASSGGLSGAYREVKDGVAGFWELSDVARDGQEVVLSMRMFERGLKDSKKTAAGPVRFVLDRVEGHTAVFSGDGANKASLTYELVNPHRLRVTLDRADGAPVERFDFARFVP